MSFVHGKGTAVLADGVDLSEYFNSSSTDKSVETDDVTTFGKDDKVFLVGLEDGSISLGGFFDGEAGAVDEILAGLFGDNNAPILTVGIAGVTDLGNPAVLMQAIETAYNISSPVGGAVTISASGQANGGVRNGGKIAHALAQEDGTFEGDAVDDGDSTAFGGVAHLHVTEFNGTDIDIRLQHSADEEAWTDLVAWEGVDGVGAVRSAFSGTVNQYVRVEVDGGTFNTATFAVSYARNRR